MLSLSVLKKDRETVSKLVKRSLIIAQALDEIGEKDMASGYIRRACDCSKKIWHLDNQISLIKANEK